MSRAVTVSLLAGILAVAPPLAEESFAQGKGQRQAAKPPAPKPGAAARPNPSAKQNGPQKQNTNRPTGDELFMRLQKMTPEEREKALAQLPPARRAQIENRIQNFQNLPPQVQERRLDRLERLNSLPQAQQRQVRQSMRDLQALPDDRKRAINQELRRMTAMPEDERQAHMGTDDFRGRFSPSEQEIVGNLTKVE